MSLIAYLKCSFFSNNINYIINNDINDIFIYDINNNH